MGNRRRWGPTALVCGAALYQIGAIIAIPFLGLYAAFIMSAGALMMLLLAARLASTRRSKPRSEGRKIGLGYEVTDEDGRRYLLRSVVHLGHPRDFLLFTPDGAYFQLEPIPAKESDDGRA